MGIVPGDQFQFLFGEEIQGSEELDARRGEGSAAYEAFLFGVIEQTVFVEDGIIAQNAIVARGQTGCAGGITGDNDFFRSFAPDHALDHIGGR